MKRSNRLILLIGVFLAALAFVFVIVLLGGGQTGGGTSASAPPTEVETVIAARDIPLGVTVTAAMVTTQVLPVTVQEAGVYADVTQAIGKVARQSITKGQQVTAYQFSDLGTAGKVEVPAGYTGIAVQVDQVSGAGTLIKTGDYVDIVASVSPTFPMNSFIQNAQNAATITTLYDPTSVKVLIQGVQVVATLLPPPPATEAGVATPAPDSGGTALTGQQEIVILAVTQQQAEVIKFAQLDGSITLMLRSPRDFVDENGNPVVPVTVTTTGIVLKTLIDEWGVLPPLPIVIPEPTPIP
ncbi:MAG TPA: Flp pilus assembly protein CpaB [Candidatus Sulfomarinibacteraceae bacterium]|nr:Flp pilus assembly protein CpaB [Candidatus Sulfomarinibacteraceae bacterium]